MCEVWLHSGFEQGLQFAVHFIEPAPKLLFQGNPKGVSFFIGELTKLLYVLLVRL